MQNITLAELVQAIVPNCPRISDLLGTCAATKGHLESPRCSIEAADLLQRLLTWDRVPSMGRCLDGLESYHQRLQALDGVVR